MFDNALSRALELVPVRLEARWRRESKKLKSHAFGVRTRYQLFF